MKEHVAHMRALGYRYDTNEESLLRFDRFLQRRPELSGLALNGLVERWAEEQPSPCRLFDARLAGRIVSKAMHGGPPAASCSSAMVLLEPRVSITALPTSTQTRKYREYCKRHLRTRLRKPRGARSGCSRC